MLLIHAVGAILGLLLFLEARRPLRLRDSIHEASRNDIVQEPGLPEPKNVHVTPVVMPAETESCVDRITLASRNQAPPPNPTAVSVRPADLPGTRILPWAARCGARFGPDHRDRVEGRHCDTGEELIGSSVGTHRQRRRPFGPAVDGIFNFRLARAVHLSPSGMQVVRSVDSHRYVPLIITARVDGRPRGPRRPTICRNAE